MLCIAKKIIVHWRIDSNGGRNRRNIKTKSLKYERIGFKKIIDENAYLDRKPDSKARRTRGPLGRR